MAAVTTAAIGVAAAGYQIYNAEQKKKAAQKELNSYERQELNNAFENVQVSTMGSDLLREENARTSASLINAAQLSGTRSIIGGIPKIVSSTNAINQEAAKLIDDQVVKREYAIAGDNARIEGITENRDIANISALSSQIDSANQDKWNGINSAITSASYLGRNINQNKSTQIDNSNSFNPPDQNFSEGINYTPSSPYFTTPMSSPGKAYSFSNNGFQKPDINFSDNIDYKQTYRF